MAEKRAGRVARADALGLAVQRLVREGFPQTVVDTLRGMGSSPLGFRYAGSTADAAAARFIAGQMESIGLAGVRREPVPVDAYEFRGANLTVGSRVLPASTFGGVPATPADGLTGELVDAGAGTAHDFDELGDVRGKLVLVDLRLSSWWLDVPCHEATLHGALGVVLTFTPDDPVSFAEPAALGSFDGHYGATWAPAIYVSGESGRWLRSELRSRHVVATLVNDVTVTTAEQGGVAHNVVGEIPGTTDAGVRILLTAHHDAYFRAAADDASGVAQLLTLARAMVESGERARSSILFMASTAEEYGRQDSIYDFCIGAWWAISQTHPDWIGSTLLNINLEAQGVSGAALEVRAEPELATWLHATMGGSPELLPHGTKLIDRVTCTSDQWTIAAAGIPSVYLGTNDPEVSARVGHTQFDTGALLDWGYFELNALFVVDLVGAVDGAGLLPLDFAARARHVAAAVGEERLRAAGVDEAAIGSLRENLGALEAAARSLAMRAKGFGKEAMERADRGLLEVERLLNRGLLALDPRDAPIYPHEQVLANVEALQAAVAELRRPRPDAGLALQALGQVDLTAWGCRFSRETYVGELVRRSPTFERIAWGGQAHLHEPLDVMDEYGQIVAGDWSSAAGSLEAVLVRHQGELRARVRAMAAVLGDSAARLAALR